MNQSHQEYYSARAAAARIQAQRAAYPAIAAIHLDLATRYEMLLAQPERSEEFALAPALQAT